MESNKAHQLFWIGLSLTIIGAMLAIALLLGAITGFGKPGKLVLWFISFIMIGGGAYIIRNRKQTDSLFSMVRSIYNGIAILTLNTIILFIAANLIVYLFMSFFPKQAKFNRSYLESLWQESTRYFTTPKAEWVNNKDFVRKIYDGYADEDIAQLMYTPSMRSHPTLEYMETPSQSEHYNVGFENMRYSRFVHEGNAAEKINGAVWVFGGSTAFGDGVSDDETIAAYLNELDSSQTYINFGVQGYNQNAEIEKLLLLLKKGYRPKRAIFIDGLNDITLMRSARFHPAETPARGFCAYNYVSNIERVQRPELALLLRRLPLFEWLYSSLEKQKHGATASVSVKNGYEDIYATENFYHADPALHYHLSSVWESEFDSVYAYIDHYRQKILQYYELNNAYLNELATAFDFEYAVFFQPLGYAALKNPFITDAEKYAETKQYQTYLAMKKSVQNAIAEGRLTHFYDIADADQGCADCYVDLLHYNRDLNRLIASRILGL